MRLATVAAIVLVAMICLPRLAFAAAGQFSLDDAYREDISPVRARISLNGLWRFQPALDASTAAPSAGWGSLRVPGRWNGEDVAYGGFTVRDERGAAVGDWLGVKLGAVTDVWYQREFAPPKEWAGRRIIIRFDHLGAGIGGRAADYVAHARIDEGLRHNATIWVNGQRAPIEDDWSVDVTALVHPGAPNILTVGVRSKDASRWGRGLNGDVWLECEPPVRIEETDWATSYADHTLGLRVTVRNGETSPHELRLRASLDGKVVGESPKADAAAGQEAALDLHVAVPGLASWSEFDPRLTTLRLELLDGDTVLDTSVEHIAMRDVRIEGTALTLNGRHLALRLESGPSLGYGMEVFDRDFMRAYIAAYRAANYNGFRSMWGRVPDHVYDLTDQLGMMVVAILPSPGQFRARSGIADDARFWPAYEAELARLIAGPRRHVSVIAWELWAHEAPDVLQNQPDHIAGDWTSAIHIHDRDRADLRKAADILRRLDPSREVLFDETGSFGKMVDVHPYFGFSIPLQEWEDWPEHRAGKATKPLLASEFGVPYVGQWREWNPVSWEWQDGHAFIIENAARYLGDAAYTESRSAMIEHDWTMRGQAFPPDTAIDPALTGSEAGGTRYRPNAAAEAVSALFATRVYRAWRAAGIDLGPFEQDTMAGAGMLFQPLDPAPQREMAVKSLKTPGPKPDHVEPSRGVYARTALPVASPTLAPGAKTPYAPTATFAATQAAFAPLLAYIGGDPQEGITSRDHAFASGEAIEKSVVLVNDGPADARVSVRWALVGGGGKAEAQGTATVTAPQGRTTIAPIHLVAPSVQARAAYRLTLEASVEGKPAGHDGFDLQIFPANPPPLHVGADVRIGLYDKSGATARALDAMGVRYRRLDRLDDSHDFDLLIIGALSLDESARQLKPLIENGLRVLELEQRVGAMADVAAYTGSNLDTTHMVAVATRNVFAADAGSPVLAGLEAADFADWRGGSELLPAFAPASETAYLYRPGGAEGIKSSNRGIVASYVIPKPQRGNFRVILACGFDLRQTPLAEYFIGRGRLLVMQLDATARYGKDPVATRLLRNALSYMAAPGPAWKRAAYLGDGGGARLFASLGADPPPLKSAADLARTDVVLAGAGAAAPLQQERAAVLAWVKQGGRLVLADDVVARLGAGWFPSPVSVAPFTLYKGRMPPNEELLRGLNQSDAYFRQGIAFNRLALPGEKGDAAPVTVLHFGTGAIVTLPVASTVALPSAGQDAQAKTTPAADKAMRMISTILTNSGVALASPFSLAPDIVDLAGEWRFQTDPQDRGTGAGWGKADFDDSGWRKIRVPGLWAFQNVPGPPSKGGIGYDGVAWYRRTVAIPAGWKGGSAPVRLMIAGLRDTGDVYWNGRLIAHGADKEYFFDRVSLPIEPALLPANGIASIAIRVVDKGPAGGLAGAISLRKDDSWLTPRLDVAYGERFPTFDPDSYKYW